MLWKLTCNPKAADLYRGFRFYDGEKYLLIYSAYYEVIMLCHSVQMAGISGGESACSVKADY